MWNVSVPPEANTQPAGGARTRLADSLEMFLSQRDDSLFAGPYPHATTDTFYIYAHLFIHLEKHIIYIYIDRERERELESQT